MADPHRIPSKKYRFINQIPAFSRADNPSNSLYEMEITISDKQSIAQVKTFFTEPFPFLKLEFYINEHQTGEGNSDQSIHGNQKVSTLEQAFHDQCNLNVQVSLKSNEVWLQTTATDEWTLSEQNHTAREHHH